MSTTEVTIPRFANPYENPGTEKWYRGNLHCHAGVGAPGWKDRARATVDAYRGAGYHFLNFSEHYVCEDSAALSEREFLVLTGEECGNPHTVATGIKSTIPKNGLRGGAGIRDLVEKIHEQGGLAVVAHPRVGEGTSGALTWEDLSGTDGYLGIEVFNHHSESRFGREIAVEIWDLLLDSGRKVWGFASDDAHAPTRDEVGHGWIEVLAPSLTQEAIFASMRAGRFIASQGPRFHSITLTPTSIDVRCTPVRSVRFLAMRGKGRMIHAPPGELIESASYNLLADALRVGNGLRIELVDEHGLRGWSQPLFRQAD